MAVATRAVCTTAEAQLAWRGLFIHWPDIFSSHEERTVCMERLGVALAHRVWGEELLGRAQQMSKADRLLHQS